MTDNVNHPAHYESNGPFECIELTQHYDFCLGNAIKYVWRHMSKGKPLEDLAKALWYIQQESELKRGAYIIPYDAPWWMSYKEQDELINQLASTNFADMKDFWEALAKHNLTAMRAAIQARIEKLTANYPTRVILTDEITRQTIR